MINTSIQQYQDFKAAESFCIAAYGSKELSSPDDEKYENNVFYSRLKEWLMNQAQQLRSSSSEVGAPTQLGLLKTEEDQLKQVIMRIKVSPFILFGQQLADRILTLFKDAKEEDELSVGITPGSLQSFYSFISAHSELKRPKLSLTPENNIYASWKAGNDKVFSVHFLSNRDTRFVIFKPNKRYPDRPIRISGIAPVDDLMQEAIIPHSVSWALE